MNAITKQSNKSMLPVEKLRLENVRNGILCLTFDDARYTEWLKVLDIFRKYGAHATFFDSGDITPVVIESMKTLQKEGHSIGLHTLRHRDAPTMEETSPDEYIETEILPQLKPLEEVSFSIDLFAYPNNRRTEQTDKVLSRYFRRFRAGISPRPDPPTGYWIANQPQAFLPLAKISSTAVLGGCGIGSYYLSTQENLDAALEKAAETNTLIVFFSHGISSNPNRIDMSIEILEKMLKKASSLGMQIVGFDNLP